jgi:ABC-type Zn uptake system ZnuABC Zn-binding protein ZnuA
MAKASIDKLNILHDLIADYYAEAIESGEELSSGTLAAINAFLKNNNITVDLVEESPTQNLTFKLQELMKEKKENSA